MTTPPFSTGSWERWFAWKPVRMWGSGQIAWGRFVWRRWAFGAAGIMHTDYTDEPGQHPQNHGDDLVS